MTEQIPVTSVKHLGFAWFAMVMGLCCLSLAWARAVPHWGSAALQVSLRVGVLAAGVLTLLLLRYPAALLFDARHPFWGQLLQREGPATLPKAGAEPFQPTDS